MTIVFSSSIHGSTSISTLLMCSSSSSSSFYRPIVAKIGQNQSYWASIETDIEAHLKKVISIRPPESVFEPMHYLTFATPKSTAPALCVAACELVGGDRAQAMPAASAIHLMHVAAYTHQHMQMASKPESKPGPAVGHELGLNTELLALGPAHKNSYKNLLKVIEPEIVHKFGPNIELLTGDAIMSFAIELLAKAVSNNNNDIFSLNPQVKFGEGRMYGDISPTLGDKEVVSYKHSAQEKAMSPTRINSDKILRVIVEVTRAMGSKGLVEGRYREVEWTRSGNGDEELLEYVCKKKEGEIHACGAACGAILGNGSDEEVESLRKYGLYVGMIQGIINGSIGRNHNKERVEEFRVLAMKELKTNFKGKKFVRQISSLVEEFFGPLSNCNLV